MCTVPKLGGDINARWEICQGNSHWFSVLQNELSKYSEILEVGYASTWSRVHEQFTYPLLLYPQKHNPWLSVFPNERDFIQIGEFFLCKTCSCYKCFISPCRTAWDIIDYYTNVPLGVDCNLGGALLRKQHLKFLRVVSSFSHSRHQWTCTNFSMCCATKKHIKNRKHSNLTPFYQKHKCKIYL